MAVDLRKSATLVSAQELTKIVNHAVKAAGERSGATGPVVLRWELAGRVIRPGPDALKLAHDFADTVARQVTLGGIEATPAVLIIDKEITAGFFERAAVPQQRNLS